MIWTLIFVIMLIVGIILLAKNNSNISEGLGTLFTVIGLIASVICTACIVSVHIGVQTQIEENNIIYESLCERLDVANSEYEDVSKSDVIKDVAEWNKEVIHGRYWAYNPWTNWFYSKKVVDNKKLIEASK